MKQVLFIIIDLLYCTACQQEVNEQNESSAIEVKAEDKAKAPQYLSRSDAAERLRDYAKSHPSNSAILHTSKGDITIRLYNETPLHRANFLRLTERKYYDGTYFHRVVPNFVIQGGGTDEFNKKVKIGKYRIPAEINASKYIHKRGAVAMARYDEKNPNKESDSHEFYIVWGDNFNAKTLQATIQKYGLKLGKEQRSVYLSEGGSPHLDGLYTVFGEVTSGMEVVEEIVKMKVDKRGWPLENVDMTVEVVEIDK